MQNRVYSKTSEQQPVLGTDRLTFVERVASLRGVLRVLCQATIIIHNIIEINLLR